MRLCGVSRALAMGAPQLRSTIQRHIIHIYDEDELSIDSTCAFFAQVETLKKLPWRINFVGKGVMLLNFQQNPFLFF